MLYQDRNFGSFSPRVKFVEWRLSFYTNESVLFESHLLHQLRAVSKIINGNFTFISQFQDKRLTPLARQVIEEQPQLKEHDWLSKDKIKRYERDALK